MYEHDALEQYGAFWPNGVMAIRIQPKDYAGLIDAARGIRPCDLVIDNARIVNVFTGEIYPGAVGIYDGFIAHVQSDPDDSKREEKPMVGKVHLDAGNDYLLPGLLDAHVHIESSMMTPARFAEAVIPHGTTTIMTDPHEIANVAGMAGVRYMLEASRDLPMRQLVMVPSCVPSVPGKEHSGAVFTADDIETMLEMERVIGLAEVMDYPGVLHHDSRMSGILQKALDRDVFIQGHAPFLYGRELSAYRAAGPQSDHESRTGQEARDKIRVGMVVDARESSGAKNVRDILTGIQGFRYLDYLTLCTDDREPEDILLKGHMNDVVKSAVDSGLDPVDAIRCATLNIARSVGLRNVGAVAPGYTADLILAADLTHIQPTRVFFAGVEVAHQGVLKQSIPEVDHPFQHKNTIHVNDVSIETFRFRAPIEEGRIPTRIIAYRESTSSTTDFMVEELPVHGGYLDLAHRPDLKYAVILNRHGGIASRGYGIVKDIGLRRGAVANSVAHDCHNLGVVFDTAENALIAVRDIQAMGGGFSCVLDQQVLGRLPLPVGGLMADRSVWEMAAAAADMKAALRMLGLNEMENPLLRTAFLTLAVIPHAKMTDLGMIDVDRQEIMPLYVD